MIDVNRRVLPGFGLSLGYTILYMSLVVAIPMAAGFVKAANLSLGEFWHAVSSERAVAAYTLTVGAALGLALVLAGADLLQGIVLQASPRNPALIATVILSILLLALVACWSPARKAGSCLFSTKMTV